jgi:hypothetical protein
MEQVLSEVLPKERQALFLECLDAAGVFCEPLGIGGQDTLTQRPALALTIGGRWRVAPDTSSLFPLPSSLCRFGLGFTIGEGVLPDGSPEVFHPEIRRRRPALIELISSGHRETLGGRVDVVEVAA